MKNTQRRSQRPGLAREKEILVHLNHTTDQPIEEWRDIPGYEGCYQASSFGRIRSLDRTITHIDHWGRTVARHKKGKILRLAKQSNGYLFIQLGRASSQTTIHALVALTYLGDRPHDHDIHHINDQKTDNRSVNLEYIPESDHMSMHLKGNTRTAKITEDQAREIFRLYHEEHRTASQIAPLYDISTSSVLRIKRGEAWQSIHATL